MNPKEALQQIRALFEDMPQPAQPPVAQEAPVAQEVTKVEMAEYSLADGSKIMISALEVGGKVESAEGIPAPQGDYQLMDGTAIKVDESGVITEVVAPKDEVVVVEPEAPAQVAVEELKAEFAEQKSQLEAKIAELENKVKQGFAQVAELVEALSNTPTVEPTQKAANAFQSYVTTSDSKYERLEKYRNAILNK